MINVLRGNLKKRDMARFVGVKPKELDQSLVNINNMGHIIYEKIRGRYYFVVFGEPVKELTLGNG